MSYKFSFDDVHPFYYLFFISNSPQKLTLPLCIVVKKFNLTLIKRQVLRINFKGTSAISWKRSDGFVGMIKNPKGLSTKHCLAKISTKRKIGKIKKLLNNMSMARMLRSLYYLPALPKDLSRKFNHFFYKLLSGFHFLDQFRIPLPHLIILNIYEYPILLLVPLQECRQKRRIHHEPLPDLPVPGQLYRQDGYIPREVWRRRQDRLRHSLLVNPAAGLRGRSQLLSDAATMMLMLCRQQRRLLWLHRISHPPHLRCDCQIFRW